VLYLDRDPQMQKCGRPSLPETLWIYGMGNLGGNLDVDMDAVPLVRPMDLTQENSLPAFTVPRSHHLFGDKDPFNGKHFFLTPFVLSTAP
jgi:hypothetical protein